MATKKPRKPSKTAQEYKKELARIKRFIKSAEKRGYSFAGYEPPKEPKKITTKSVEKLKAITPKTLYAKATYYDLILGQRVSGTEERKLTRSRASKKAYQTRLKKLGGVSAKIGKFRSKDTSEYSQPGQPPSDVDDVLRSLYELIAQWKPDPRWNEGFIRIKEHDKNVLKNIIDGAVNDLGRRQVAINAQSQAARIKDLAWYICYGYSGSDKDRSTQSDIVELTNILRGRALTTEEAKQIADETAYL